MAAGGMKTHTSGLPASVSSSTEKAGRGEGGKSAYTLRAVTKPGAGCWRGGWRVQLLHKRQLQSLTQSLLGATGIQRGRVQFTRTETEISHGRTPLRADPPPARVHAPGLDQQAPWRPSSLGTCRGPGRGGSTLQSLRMSGDLLTGLKSSNQSSKNCCFVNIVRCWDLDVDFPPPIHKTLNHVKRPNKETEIQAS